MAIRKITPFTGDTPDKATQTKEVFADNVYATHLFYDNSMVSDVNNSIDDMNSEIGGLNDQLVYVNYKGDYVAGATYTQGESVTYLDILYYSKSDGNIGNTPDTNPSLWQETGTASSLPYDNTSSGLLSDNTQDAIDELVTHGGSAGNITYDNSTSGLAATNVQEGIDELASKPSGTSSFIASGAITDGEPVALNSDGTVSSIDLVGQDKIVGDFEVFPSRMDSYTLRTVYDSDNDTFLVVYRDYDDTFLYARIGTIDGSDINYGDPTLLDSVNISAGGIGLVYDRISKQFIITYGDSTNSLGKVLVIKADSNSAIAIGLPVTLVAGNCGNPKDVIYDPINNVLLSSMVAGSHSDVYFDILTIGVLTVTVDGTLVDSGSYFMTRLVYDISAKKFLNLRRDNGDVFSARAVSISSSTITVSAAETSYSSSNTSYVGFCYDPIREITLFSSREGTNNYTFAHTWKLAGTTVSKGVTTTISTQVGYSSAMSFDPVTDKMYCIYNGTSKYLNLMELTTSGTGIIKGTNSVIMSSSATSSLDMAYGSKSTKTLILSGELYNKSGTYEAAKTTTNADRLIGIANSTSVDGEETETLLHSSVSSKQSGLSTGLNHYIDDNGVLSTARSDYKVGVALSDTELQITGGLQ